MTPVARLREAIELVLMFHQEMPWTDEAAERWTAVTGHPAASTRSMCDHLRNVLNETRQAEISAKAVR